MNQCITHIFFDLGNILVGLHAGKKLRALAKKSGQDLAPFCEKIWSHERAHDYERGSHSCDEYFSLLAENWTSPTPNRSCGKPFAIFFTLSRSGWPSRVSWLLVIRSA